jgi:hypothetical protein
MVLFGVIGLSLVWNEKTYTMTPFDDVTEGSTQEATMGAF